ncbi:hypothetical protein JE034_09795 [Achromobacter xylosoxidans]|uniref:hypothetical protein n=1 Tax=Alcaligenes xylosoxydans xylosoxydans TaxID=85698 RepID=UPI001905031E|nr:hypothetical protein [Achromobacter xylosoxidans]MBK1979150.1 hypothetical protein [Achromobacter xylosoxidans]
MNDCSDQDTIEDFVDFVQGQISRHPNTIDTTHRRHLADIEADILVHSKSGRDLYVYCCFSEDLEATRARAISEQRSDSRNLIVCIDWLDASTPNLYLHPGDTKRIYESGQIPIADAAYTFEWHWESIAHDFSDRCMQQHLNKQIGNSLKSTLQGHPPTIKYAQFEHLVNAIFKFCFFPYLTLRDTQVPTERSMRIRDAVYDVDHHRLIALTLFGPPYITVEAKNLKGEVGQDEVDQLANYLNPNGLGNFGILVSRQNIDTNGRQAILDWRKKTPPKTVLHLDELDLVELINRRINGSPDACIDLLLDKHFDLARRVR